jgi:hypothetical protein
MIFAKSGSWRFRWLPASLGFIQIRQSELSALRQSYFLCHGFFVGNPPLIALNPLISLVSAVGKQIAYYLIKADLVYYALFD